MRDEARTKLRAARERQACIDAQRRLLRAHAGRHEEARLLAEVRRDLFLEGLDPLALAVHVAHARLKVRLDLGGFRRQLSQDGAGAGARGGGGMHQVDGLGSRRCRGRGMRTEQSREQQSAEHVGPSSSRTCAQHVGPSAQRASRRLPTRRYVSGTPADDRLCEANHFPTESKKVLTHLLGSYRLPTACRQ